MTSGPALPNSRTNLLRRRVLLSATCLLGLGIWLPLTFGPQLAAQDGSEQDLRPRQDQLTTKDGYQLAITYWPSGLKQDAAVVVLLHGSGGNQLDWGAFPKQLQDQGYAVINVDLRGHGQTKGPGDNADTKTAKGKTKPKSGKSVESTTLRARDYEAMVAFDMEAVKQFIFNEHQAKRLNMNRTGFIGAGLGGAVALRAAAVDWLKKPHTDGPVGNQTPRGQDVRALVLLTPDSEVAGLPLPDAVKTLRAPPLQVAILFAVGKKDRLDKGQTKKLFDQAVSPDGNDQRMYMPEYNTQARGTQLLGMGSQVETNVMNFLKKHLQEISSTWRDRESRVGRKKGT